MEDVMEKTEYQLGVEAERKRIMEELHRYKVEAFELIPIEQQPGVNKSLVRRFGTAELIARIWGSSND
jgi:hypothetical protein